MANDFEIDAYRRGHELFVILRGRLVLSFCQDAKTRLGNLLSPQTDQLYLFLTELSFLDSAGLGVLVGLKMTANRNHTRLILLCPPPRIQDIFRVSKLDTIFEIRCGTEAEVIVASLRQAEFCLWRDSKDDRQGLYNTEVDCSPRALGQLTVAEDDAGNAKIRQLCDDAVEFIRQGDYQKAIESYRRALTLDPDSLSALNNLGIVYEKRPEWYPEAAEIWGRVLRLSERSNDEKHASRARKHLETLAKLSRIT